MAKSNVTNREGSQKVHNTERRRFLGALLGFSVLATMAGVLTPIVGYLWPPENASAQGGGRALVGSEAEFPPGQGKVVPVNDKPVIVVNTPQGGIKAFSAICTHLGCITEWDERRQFILCPCHDGKFNAISGAVISGPAPAPLPEIPVVVEDGAVYLDASQT
jgi:cytochrome b6-f complex iron-sulfur subunit